MKIKISRDKLQKILIDNQDSMIGLSKKLGKNDGYISQVFTRYGGEIEDTIANLICLLYEIQLEDIKPDPAHKTDTQKAFTILREENKKNTKEIMAAQEDIVHLLEKILTKVNANTMQIERIKQEAIVSHTDPVHEAKVFFESHARKWPNERHDDPDKSRDGRNYSCESYQGKTGAEH